MAVQPIIQIKGLNKSFPSANGELQVLKDINIDIMAGEIFGIIGMSGAGKSTLVRCINFLEKPTSGQIIFDGKDLGAIPKSGLYMARQSMGMIFQQFNLLMQRTAQKNVIFPLEIAHGGKSDKAGKMDKTAMKKRADELLGIVGMADKTKNFPAQLSGGQRQRVAIARALATNPKVLLCDEATSALDPSTTRGVLSLLGDINKRLGITIVVITHEMSVIEEICDRVAILDGGDVVEMGTVQEIFSHPKSEAARRLVYPNEHKRETSFGGRCVRVVFDGNSSFEPIVANMVLHFHQPVNIMFADTKDVGGRAFGQIVLQLPEDDLTADRMIEYIKASGFTAEEAEGYV